MPLEQSAKPPQRRRGLRPRGQNSRRNGKRRAIFTVVALVTVAVFAGLGVGIWNGWKDDEHESMCQPHRTQALALSDKARAVRIPMVFAGDPSISILQLGRSSPKAWEASTPSPRPSWTYPGRTPRSGPWPGRQHALFSITESASGTISPPLPPG